MEQVGQLLVKHDLAVERTIDLSSLRLMIWDSAERILTVQFVSTHLTGLYFFDLLWDDDGSRMLHKARVICAKDLTDAQILVKCQALLQEIKERKGAKPGDDGTPKRVPGAPSLPGGKPRPPSAP